MYFCSQCQNMYYLKIRDDEEKNALVYYCRNCGHEDHTLTSENVCVSETQIQRSEQQYTHMVNEYTKYDPTLPRINTIKCPNQECSSNDAAGYTPAADYSSSEKMLASASTAASASTRVEEDVEEQEEDYDGLAAAAASQQQQMEMEGGGGSGSGKKTTKSRAAATKKTAKKTPAPTSREVIYIRYDDINMKYIYLCVHCNTMWRTDNRV